MFSPDPCEFVLRRDIEAKPAVVRDAWTDQEKRTRWWTGDANVTVTITCERGRRGNTRLILRAVCASAENRRVLLRSGLLEVWAKNVDRLQALLAGEAAHPSA